MPDSQHSPHAVPPLQAEWVMRLDVVCAEEILVGDFAEGRRLNYPIVGGSFHGPALRGEVMNGGADWYLDRKDGIGQPNARYCLKTHDGVVIQVSNHALLRYVPGVVESDLPAWPPSPELYTCRCAPVFQAPAGPYAWLNHAVFVGEIRYETEDGVTLDVFRLV